MCTEEHASWAADESGQAVGAAGLDPAVSGVVHVRC